MFCGILSKLIFSEISYNSQVLSSISIYPRNESIKVVRNTRIVDGIFRFSPRLF